MHIFLVTMGMGNFSLMASKSFLLPEIMSLAVQAAVHVKSATFCWIINLKCAYEVDPAFGDLQH